METNACPYCGVRQKRQHREEYVLRTVYDCGTSFRRVVGLSKSHPLWKQSTACFREQINPWAKPNLLTQARS